MQAARFSSPDGPPRRGRLPPSSLDMPSATPNPAQTSLPSIRQLHPYLDPSGPYNYPPPSSGSGYSPSAGAMDGIMNHQPQLPPPPPASQQQQQRDTEYYPGGVDSDADDAYEQGPPKKKRRRQALSCTECKRRKIKCDRNQPCAPCARRGEQAKCQWHIVEPVEKYVTRAEYDDLKSRFDQLWALVHRMLPQASSGPSTAMSYYPIAGGPSVEPVQQFPTSVYSSIMAPPHGYPPHLDPTSTSMHTPHRYSARPEESQSPRHQASGTGSGASPVMSTLQPSTQQSRSTSSRAAGPDHKAPGSSGGATAAGGPGSSRGRSPLSLTSITGPTYDVPVGSSSSSSSHQSKNLHAQTLILGERLRPEATTTSEGPATLIISRRIRPRSRSRRALSRTTSSRTCTWTARRALLDPYHPRLPLHPRRRFSSVPPQAPATCAE